MDSVVVNTKVAASATILYLWLDIGPPPNELEAHDARQAGESPDELLRFC
jgi:hypothetical protein